MRITVTVEQLRDAISRAVKLTPSNPRLAAHAGIILHVRGTTLRVVSTDGDSTLAVTAGSGTGGRDGQISVPPQALSRYLRTLATDTPVVLEADEETEDLTVTPSDGATYHFRPMQTGFTLPAALRSEPAQVDWSRLPEAVAAIAPSVGEDDAVKVISDEQTLTLITTDRYRLGRVQLAGGGFGEFNGVLPLAALQLAAESGITEVIVSSDDKTLRLSGPSTVLTTRVMSVVFPAVGPVFKQVPATCVHLSVPELSRTLQRLATVAGEEHVRLTFTDEQLQLDVANRTIGSASETLALDGVTSALVAGVSPVYLRQALLAQPGEQVEMGWTGPMNPLYLSSSDGPVALTVVVMPVRLPGD